MTSRFGLLHEVHAGLLKLYPKAFQEEYAEELQSVFDLAVEDAAVKGGFEVERLVLRELVSLPRAVILEYMRERRNAKMIRSFDSYFNFAFGSGKEFLTALLPFFLAGGVMPLLNYLGRAGMATNAVSTAIMLALFSLFLILLVLGVKTGIPRWSLPYFGFLLAILSVYLFSIIFGTPIYFLFRNVHDQSLLVMDVLWDGIFWYGLLTAIVVLIAASRRSPVFQYLKNDWTQLCFILYGGAPFALLLTFDEYVGDEPYMFLSFLVLAVGVWFYLRSQDEWKRFGSLFIALTVAISIAAAAKAILIPTQDWPFTIDQGLVRAEVKHTLIMLGWFAAGMLLPVAARFLPGSGELVQVSPSEG